MKINQNRFNSKIVTLVVLLNWSFSIQFAFTESYYLNWAQASDSLTVNQSTDSFKQLFLHTIQSDKIEDYSKFIQLYPQTEEAKQLQSKIQNLEYQHSIKSKNAKDYQDFIRKYPNSNWINAVQDSLLQLSTSSQDLKSLKFCIDNFKGQRRSTALKHYYEIYTNDGESQSLDIFFKTFGNEIPKEIKSKDYELARMSNKLLLNLPYSDWKFQRYDEYIRLAAPREKAFVALQRLISNDLAIQNWSSAIKKVRTYAYYFGKNNKKINNLLDLLNAKWNNSVKINSFGNSINTEDGGEYSPVVTANDEQMYFCGSRRKDNLGGEDIFVSKKQNGIWAQAKIVPELSSKYSNEAPISISADGTMILLFKSGKLLYSTKSVSGWSKPVEFPKTINSNGYQLDGMLTGDGKGLLFSSTRSGGLNHLNSVQKYHGDEQYPSDIYISLLTSDQKWGEPINLGPVINTQYCERTPFLHADQKTLYFSSDGHGGLGKLDVFKSTRLADTCWNCWSEPVNLGKEINTASSDVGYKVSTAGDKAYFSYERKSNFNSSILLLLDVSGSMSGSKLKALKEATTAVCQTAIQNSSEISILTFSNNCNTPITDSCAFSREIAPLLQFIDNIRVGGDTPTFEAYEYACQYLKRNADKHSANKVIMLLTDGDANGCIELDSALNKIKHDNMLYKTQTILYDLTDISIAFQDLQKIASNSNGKFYSTRQYDDLGSAFEAANNEIFNFSLSGDKDIFWLNLPRNLRPGYVSTVSGKLITKDNKPMSAEVRWDDLETGKNLGITKSDPDDGSFFIVLPMGKIYGYYADKESYMSVSNSIDLRTEEKPVNIKENIDLFTLEQMVESGNAIKVNNVFFDFGKSTLLPYSEPELMRLAQLIKTKKLKIELSGHTDDIGTDESNMILSEKRAEAVKDFLIKAGCEPTDLSTVGYGETKAFTSNRTKIGRAKNRRVELRLLNKQNDKK